MNERRLFLLRHGETDYNKQHIVQGGGVDSELNATGREQARRFFQRYHTHPFVHVASSAMKRAQQTVAPFAALGYSMQTHEGLNEFHWGKYENQIFDEATQAETMPLRDAWAAGELSVQVPGGESPLMVRDRAAAAVEEIIGSAGPEGDILVCAHGRTIAILLSHFLYADCSRMTDFKFPNTALHLLNHQPPTFAAIKLGDTTHLSAVV